MGAVSGLETGKLDAEGAHLFQIIGVEAALSGDVTDGREPEVGIGWTVLGGQVVVRIRDSGRG